VSRGGALLHCINISDAHTPLGGEINTPDGVATVDSKWVAVSLRHRCDGDGRRSWSRVRRN
jgi:hypothetical protein